MKPVELKFEREIIYVGRAEEEGNLGEVPHKALYTSLQTINTASHPIPNSTASSKEQISSSVL